MQSRTTSQNNCPPCASPWLICDQPDDCCPGPPDRLRGSLPFAVSARVARHCSGWFWVCAIALMVGDSGGASYQQARGRGRLLADRFVGPFLATVPGAGTLERAASDFKLHWIDRSHGTSKKTGGCSTRRLAESESPCSFLHRKARQRVRKLTALYNL